MKEKTIWKVKYWTSKFMASKSDLTENMHTHLASFDSDSFHIGCFIRIVSENVGHIDYHTQQPWAQAKWWDQDNSSGIFSRNSRSNSSAKSRRQPQSSTKLSTTSASSAHNLPALAPMRNVASTNKLPETSQKKEGKNFPIPLQQHSQSQWTSLCGCMQCIMPCSCIIHHVFWKAASWAF